MSHRRGNPNWGKPGGRIPDLPTAFEQQVRRLGLTRRTCARSLALREWCQHNRNRCYIPEWLLKEWGITVDLSFSDAA
jgi:hypothetical protein